MEKQVFYIVDVFAEAKYEGNQLAVCRHLKDHCDERMQRIAKEMNYSETTFILSDEDQDSGYDVRIFTPEKEVPFAGHPTLGTAYIIQREIIGKRVEEVRLNLKVGQIPVTFTYSEEKADILWMRQMQPTFDRIFDKATISKALSLEENEIDGELPVQEVSTGLPFIIVPLKDLDAVKRAKIDKIRFFELIEKTQAKAILIFCRETYHEENDLSVRVFADYYGVPEDPATGSANGCLNSYLVRHQYFGEKRIDIRVEQGYEIGRPSLLFLRGEDREEDVEVFVGGRVILVAEGVLV